MTTRLYTLSFLAVLVSVLSACTSSSYIPDEVDHALLSSESVLLLSLEPWAEHADGPEFFHGYKILGSVKLHGEDSRNVVKEFRSVVYPFPENVVPGCFDPRHALRLIYKEHTYDLLLCYACAQMIIDKDNQRLSRLLVKGSPNALNKLLKSKNVPISDSDPHSEAQQ